MYRSAAAVLIALGTCSPAAAQSSDNKQNHDGALLEEVYGILLKARTI
jgi:hypothetical protein